MRNNPISEMSWQLLCYQTIFPALGDIHVLHFAWRHRPESQGPSEDCVTRIKHKRNEFIRLFSLLLAQTSSKYCRFQVYVKADLESAAGSCPAYTSRFWAHPHLLRPRVNSSYGSWHQLLCSRTGVLLLCRRRECGWMKSRGTRSFLFSGCRHRLELSLSIFLPKDLEIPVELMQVSELALGRQSG